MNKRALSESDICDKYIRPAMERAGWHGMDQIYREYALRADYALFFKTNVPLAAMEAKDNNHAIGAGMAQAINDAQLLDLPFSFSSKGDGFDFRDATLADGVLERNLTLDESPSPTELWAWYCAWKGWSDSTRHVAESDYAPSKTPRYYQLSAINRTSVPTCVSASPTAKPPSPT